MTGNGVDCRWNAPCSQSLASVVGLAKLQHQHHHPQQQQQAPPVPPHQQLRTDKANSDDGKKFNVSKIQHCDKTPTRAAKNWLVMKKDLQCERCGYVQAFGDGTTNDKPWTKGTMCRSSDEQLHRHAANRDNNGTLKSTNYRLKSGSSISLGKISTTSLTNINLTVRRRIVYAQVLLEAFGNASNHLNNNSSRFVSIISIWPLCSID